MTRRRTTIRPLPRPQKSARNKTDEPWRTGCDSAAPPFVLSGTFPIKGLVGEGGKDPREQRCIGESQ